MTGEEINNVIEGFIIKDWKEHKETKLIIPGRLENVMLDNIKFYRTEYKVGKEFSNDIIQYLLMKYEEIIEEIVERNGRKNANPIIHYTIVSKWLNKTIWRAIYLADPDGYKRYELPILEKRYEFLSRL